MNSIEDFIATVSSSIRNNEFVKLTLSKPRYKWGRLQNVYFKRSTIKQVQKLTATFSNKTDDLTKNFTLEDGMVEVASYLGHRMLYATLITTYSTVRLLSSKKGKVTIQQSATSAYQPRSDSHDCVKVKRVPLDATYLYALGITTLDGVLIPKMTYKYRQINKYLEIMEHLMDSSAFTGTIRIVDMGSGKGYLTFALYDFLRRRGIATHITGIEQRDDLVAFCRHKAKDCGFDQLDFVAQRIEEYAIAKVDILIALHACDTATDDAIAKGVHATAALIVCAPCCHKQVRQQVKGKTQGSPLLAHGIFQERHFEMVTDTLRALILEQNGYKPKIFEFVSNEHTRKNVMLVATKSNSPVSARLQAKIDLLKQEYRIDFQYLERLV